METGYLQDPEQSPKASAEELLEQLRHSTLADLVPTGLNIAAGMSEDYELRWLRIHQVDKYLVLSKLHQEMGKVIDTAQQCQDIEEKGSHIARLGYNTVIFTMLSEQRLLPIWDRFNETDLLDRVPQATLIAQSKESRGAAVKAITAECEPLGDMFTALKQASVDRAGYRESVELTDEQKYGIYSFQFGAFPAYFSIALASGALKEV